MTTENEIKPAASAEAPDKGVGTGDLLGGLEIVFWATRCTGPFQWYGKRHVRRVEADRTLCGRTIPLFGKDDKFPNTWTIYREKVTCSQCLSALPNTTVSNAEPSAPKQPEAR